MFDQIRSIQVVWFTDVEPKSPMEIFVKLLGEEPDSFQRVAPPQAPFPVVQQTIIREGVQHRLQSHVGRIDYFMDLVQDGANGKIRHMEQPEQRLEEVLHRVSLVGDAIGSITRAAMVTVMATQLGSDDEAADRFYEHVPVGVNSGGDRDLMFQLSRPLKSSDGQPQLNRLLRWSTENVTVQQFMNTPGAAVSIGSTESHYLTYMVDVNTVLTANSRYAPSEQLELFKGLVEVSKKLFGARTIEDIQ